LTVGETGAGPWEHPDWYDLHDTAWTAGSEREPEHYRETILAMPPLDRDDHVVDVGAGTGKLAALVASSYPDLGHLTLIEPNARKLERARKRLAAILPNAKVDALALRLGEGRAPAGVNAGYVTIGSVLMPIMDLRGGSLADGLAWLRRSFAEVATLLRPGGWLYCIETLAAPWARGEVVDPVRRLTMQELTAEIAQAGYDSIECVYRFRDRVAIRARRPAR
jgi:SAM-dependent methyltransferase